jgi:pimeloyl-ACP methyl ester carboxylesterase
VTMARVAVGPVSLAVTEWPGPAKGPAPKGPAVICIHGLTANHVCWASVADVLSPAHRLVAYDLRGRGESDKPDKGYSLAIHGEEMEALLDQFKLKKAILVGHSLGAHIALRFAATRPQRVERLVLIDGGLDVRHEVLESLRPAIDRLGVEFPSLDMFLGFVRMLPMFEGRWNDYLERYFRYDVEELPGGTVRAKASRQAIEEEIASLERERLWVYHHRVKAPTLIFRAPDGLLTPTDCLMTQEEGEAMAHAIPRSKLVVVPGTNHYTVLLGQHPRVKSALRAFLEGA